MKSKKIYLDHFDINGDEITVITCDSCGNQVKKEDKKWLRWHDKNVRCCFNPDYNYGINVPV